MNDLYSAAVLLLLVVGLGLAAAHNAGVRVQFAEDVQTPDQLQMPERHSQPADSHSNLPDHGHSHGHSGD